MKYKLYIGDIVLNSSDRSGLLQHVTFAKPPFDLRYVIFFFIYRDPPFDAFFYSDNNALFTDRGLERMTLLKSYYALGDADDSAPSLQFARLCQSVNTSQSYRLHIPGPS